jgi:hypothetical protein
VCRQQGASDGAARCIIGERAALETGQGRWRAWSIFMRPISATETIFPMHSRPPRAALPSLPTAMSHPPLSPAVPGISGPTPADRPPEATDLGSKGAVTQAAVTLPMGISNICIVHYKMRLAFIFALSRVCHGKNKAIKHRKALVYKEQEKNRNLLKTLDLKLVKLFVQL